MYACVCSLFHPCLVSSSCVSASLCSYLLVCAFFFWPSCASSRVVSLLCSLFVCFIQHVCVLVWCLSSLRCRGCFLVMFPPLVLVTQRVCAVPLCAHPPPPPLSMIAGFRRGSSPTVLYQGGELEDREATAGGSGGWRGRFGLRGASGFPGPSAPTTELAIRIP